MNTGLIQITVKDDRLVNLGKDFLPCITLGPDLVLYRTDSSPGHPVRSAPTFVAVLNDIIPDATR